MSRFEEILEALLLLGIAAISLGIVFFAAKLLLNVFSAGLLAGGWMVFLTALFSLVVAGTITVIAAHQLRQDNFARR